jgi:hypothetical protein
VGIKLAPKKIDENVLRICVRRTLGRIYGQIKEDGVWRSMYNHETYKLYNDPDAVKVIKLGWLRWHTQSQWEKFKGGDRCGGINVGHMEVA